METIFKVNDKVFDVRYGWGSIYNIIENSLMVHFENTIVYYHENGNFLKDDLIPSLSFTEYDYIKGGFSQERPIEIPKKGQLVYVRYSEEDPWMMRFFSHYKYNMFHCFLDQKKEGDTTAWKYCVTINPLEND